MASTTGDGRAPGGAIHDIGYRRYEGPRLGRGRIGIALFLESLRAAYGLGRSWRSKVAPFVLFGWMCLPAIVGAFTVSLTGQLALRYDEYARSMAPIIIVFVATQAPALVARDLRFRVVPLYLSRPLTRGDYVLAKYAAMAAAVLVFVGVPLTLSLASALLAELPAGEQFRDWATAMLGAILLAVVVGGTALLVAALAPRRGLGIAAIVTVLLVLTAVQLAVTEIGREAGVEALARYGPMLSPFTLVSTFMTAVFGEEGAGRDIGADAWSAGAYLAGIVTVAAGSWLLLRVRYRRVPVS